MGGWGGGAQQEEVLLALTVFDKLAQPAPTGLCVCVCVCRDTCNAVHAYTVPQGGAGVAWRSPEGAVLGYTMQ